MISRYPVLTSDWFLTHRFTRLSRSGWPKHLRDQPHRKIRSVPLPAKPDLVRASLSLVSNVTDSLPGSAYCFSPHQHPEESDDCQPMALESGRRSEVGRRAAPVGTRE